MSKAVFLLYIPVAEDGSNELREKGAETPGKQSALQIPWQEHLW